MDLELKVGEYSYKEMCELFHEKQKTGKSKQLQLKHWELYCRYERPTNRLFVVNEVYKTPLERIDGRKTNGRKSEIEEEFAILFDSLFVREFTRNMYHIANGQWQTARLTNGELSKYFGLYGDRLYYAKKDKKIDDDLFQELTSKLSGKRRSLIVDRAAKIDWVEVRKEVIVYWGDHPAYYGEEYRESFDSYRIEYVRKHRYKSLADVIKHGEWSDMSEYVLGRFKATWESSLAEKSPWVLSDYGSINRIESCISFGIKEGAERPPFHYSLEEVDSARYSFNLKTVASLVKLFEKQVPTKGWDMEQVRYLLRKYVLLPNWQDYRKRSRAA